MNHVASSALKLNQYRRFGEVGPVYRILAFDRVDESGEQWVKILLVETGEETECKAAHAAEDPVEA